jgi:hypothetical protein
MAKIDIFLTNFKNPGQGLPILGSQSQGVSCEAAQGFYQALLKQGKTELTVDDLTIMQFSPQDSILIKRACCVGGKCALEIMANESYTGPNFDEVKERIGLTEEGTLMDGILVVDQALVGESSVTNLIEQLRAEEHEVNYQPL